MGIESWAPQPDRSSTATTAPIHVLDIHEACHNVRLLPSLGRIGDLYHNAIAESFRGACRPNCSTASDGDTCVKLANAIFE